MSFITRSRRLAAVLMLSLLVRPVHCTPPSDPDPSCRSLDLLASVQNARAESARRHLLATRAGPNPLGAPKLDVQWDFTRHAPLLRIEGSADTDYQLLSATSVRGPWDAVTGLRLTASGLSWLDRSATGPGHRFYRVAVPSPLEVEPLASNFRMIDISGKAWELFYHREGKGTVILAAGSDLSALAPLQPGLNRLHTSLTAQGVQLWVVLSDSSTPRAELRAQADRLGLQMPVLIDRDLLARQVLGLRHATEAVLIRAPDFVTIYRGAVFEGENHYLTNAVRALLLGERPGVWQTTAGGPVLPALGLDGISYSADVAPVLRTYCAPCHRPGTAAPFAFASYLEAKSRVLAIRHQVVSGNMPPWHPDPEYGAFTHSLALPADAKRKLIGWLDAGAPRGAGPDPLEDIPSEAPDPDLQARLGPPDAVLALPPQLIHAAGAEPYRTFQIRSPNTNHVWLRAVALVPSSPAVVHHYALYQPLPAELVGEINLGFTFYVPGRAPQPYPEETGMYLPQRSTMLFEMHYTPNGTSTVDAPNVLLWYHQERPAKRFLTFTVVNSEFSIPPGSREYPVIAHHQFDHEVTVHSLACHMHYRGRSMMIEAIYPDGLREILLSVPRYQFHWQMRYTLAEPKTLPAGTTIEVRGTFDNSAGNLANPDPSATVGWGQQSWDEMFMGVLEISE